MNLSERNLGPYYFLFSDFGIDWGVPARNPTALALEALTLYNAFLSSNSEELRKRFLGDAEQLVEWFHPRGNFGVWLFDFLFPRAKLYKCRPPWPSALTQGLGISALIRAYDLRRKPKYLETARLALNAFEIPVTNGGVVSVDRDDGDWWYEHDNTFINHWAEALYYLAPSKGADAELKLAKKLGLKIFYKLDEVPETYYCSCKNPNPFYYNLDFFGYNCICLKCNKSIENFEYE